MGVDTAFRFQPNVRLRHFSDLSPYASPSIRGINGVLFDRHQPACASCFGRTSQRTRERRKFKLADRRPGINRAAVSTRIGRAFLR